MTPKHVVNLSVSPHYILENPENLKYLTAVLVGVENGPVNLVVVKA